MRERTCGIDLRNTYLYSGLSYCITKEAFGTLCAFVCVEGWPGLCLMFLCESAHL